MIPVLLDSKHHVHVLLLCISLSKQLFYILMKIINQWLVSPSKFVIVMINWEQDSVLSNSVCNHTCTNQTWIVPVCDPLI